MTKARDLANIISGGFTADDIPNIPASKITSGTFADARIADLSASKLTGSIADARLPATALNSNVDLTTLSASNLTSGTIPTARITALPVGVGGKVLQIKYAFNTTAHTTTSTAYSTIETVDITPIKSSSVIKLIFSGRSYTASTSIEHYGSFYRGSNILEQYTGQWSTSGATAQREIFEFYDSSHNTTSQITYSFQHKSGNSGEAMYFSPNGAADGGVYLTAMEIDT